MDQQEVVVLQCPGMPSKKFASMGTRQMVAGEDVSKCANCGYRNCDHDPVITKVDLDPAEVARHTRSSSMLDVICPDDSGREFARGPGKEEIANGLKVTLCENCHMPHWQHYSRFTLYHNSPAPKRRKNDPQTVEVVEEKQKADETHKPDSAAKKKTPPRSADIRDCKKAKK